MIEQIVYITYQLSVGIPLLLIILYGIIPLVTFLISLTILIMNPNKDFYPWPWPNKILPWIKIFDDRMPECAASIAFSFYITMWSIFLLTAVLVNDTNFILVLLVVYTLTSPLWAPWWIINHIKHKREERQKVFDRLKGK